MSHKAFKRETNSTNSHRSWRRVSKRYFRTGSVAMYSGTFLAIIAVVAISYQPPEHFDAAASSIEVRQSATQLSDVSIDDIIATSVAANVAQTANLPITNNIANLTQSLVAERVLAQNDANVVEKPQVLNINENRREIKNHKVAKGDTIKSIAEQYQVSAQTVKWANNITGDSVSVGQKLKILPVDGVLYTAQSGDSIDSIAKKYNANKDQLALFNDLEIDGVKQGQQLVIPSGTLPEEERPGYVEPVQTNNYNATNGGISGSYGGGWGSGNTLSTSGGNRYAAGNCTWYAYERRAKLGRPVGGMWGNASTWASYAAAAGYKVNGTPAVGAVMQNGGGWYGHVAIVEAVDPGKSVTISEMNAYRFGGGYNRIGNGKISWGEAVSGMYRYIH